MRRLLILALLGGCTGVEVREPTSAQPAQPQRPLQPSGAIYQYGVSYQPLFEDRRARYVGDTLTVLINEKTTASRAGDASASRSASVNVAVPTAQGLGPAKNLEGVALSGAAESQHESKEAASASNLFTGSISVTVIEVLANGNLAVSGEKRIGINNDIETLRFSGVVNPVFIVNGNTVSSSTIADARIESSARSHVQPQQILGFLARFFLSFMPFR